MRYDDEVARKAKAMTRIEVIQKAIEKEITWLQAATILRLTARHLRRIRARYERQEFTGLQDGRAGRAMPSRIPKEVVDEVCRLRTELYPDFSVKHFHEFITERHGIKVGYTWTRDILVARSLMQKAPGRGKYRRKRDRRPMRGMMLHLDASTHTWLAGVPQQDLMVMLDDADGRILYARFVEQEGTHSTLQALLFVLQRQGRFCELYTDRGSHFCRTAKAGEGPADEQNGQVARVLKNLGIRQILARSPEARGRSERAFGTLQGRLPQELRLAGVETYAEANRYLDEHFIADFNRRFTVQPTEPESAFLSAAGFDLEIMVAVQHERTVRPDNTVLFNNAVLQLPPSKDRIHFVRCPVRVHELVDGNLAVTFQGQTLARFTRDGELTQTTKRRRAA